MTAHRITYEGPASLAIPTVTRLADAKGVELTSAGPPEPLGGQPDRARLALTVEGTPDDVAAAVAVLAGDLPGEARLTVGDPR